MSLFLFVFVEVRSLKVTINGKVETLEENTTILEFIDSKGLKHENVVVK